MTPRKVHKKIRRRKLVTSNKPNDSVNIVYSGAWKIATLAGGFLVALYAAWTAWTGFGWWVPAGITYVDAHIEQALKPISLKVDAQGESILSGRIETLKGAKQLQVDARSRLDLQQHTTKDPVAVQIMQGQQKSIDETLKGIDDQIAKLSGLLQSKK